MLYHNKDKTMSVDIDIPDTYNSVCVNMSGGADSAILFFIIAKYLKEYRPNIRLSVATLNEANKNYYMGKNTRDIIDFVIKELDFKNFDTHYIYYAEKQSREVIDNFLAKMISSNIIDLFIGGTTMPPLCEGPALAEVEGKEVDIKEHSNAQLTHDERVSQPIWNSAKTMYKPFVKIDKSFIADMYYLHNLQDTMFPKTKSCTTLATNHMFVGDFDHCGKCWWCLERKWAFGKL